ncbi:MAG: amidohydrolase family protein [Gammaproteobacteria bacterium]|nr:amidohydrolase family protein [Gammaproteobacteria bacterium]
MSLLRVAVLAVALGPAQVAAEETQKPRPPIIDMHYHALSIDAYFLGTPPHPVCAPFRVFPAWDASKRGYPALFAALGGGSGCETAVVSPMTSDAVMEQSLALLRKHNVFAVTSGELDLVERWRRAAPRRIIPALSFQMSNPTPLDVLRSLHAEGRIAVFGEVAIQYEGIRPDDARFAPYLALAEELDVPVGIHIGTGPPGAPHLFGPFRNYRGRMHSPLSLEDPLVRHPRLRIYVMHAGWPMLDDTLALLFTHPQVYLDVGVINWMLPRAEFHRYLRRIVEAGFGNRVMFGSDQMVWPETLELGIEAVASADFLSDAQKRDIFYGNAARFLRLSAAEIDRHHGR